jgi:hypothetical protein
LREGGITENSQIKHRNESEDALQSEKLTIHKRSVLTPKYSGCEHYITKTGI